MKYKNVLDGMLADRSVTWLGSEREKRRYFNLRLGDRIRDDEYPRLVFGRKPNVTVRYFPGKLPIAYERKHYRHVFIYRARTACEVLGRPGSHLGRNANAIWRRNKDGSVASLEGPV